MNLLSFPSSRRGSQSPTFTRACVMRFKREEEPSRQQRPQFTDPPLVPTKFPPLLLVTYGAERWHGAAVISLCFGYVAIARFEFGRDSDTLNALHRLASRVPLWRLRGSADVGNSEPVSTRAGVVAGGGQEPSTAVLRSGSAPSAVLNRRSRRVAPSRAKIHDRAEPSRRILGSRRSEDHRREVGVVGRRRSGGGHIGRWDRSAGGNRRH